ncbi:MAG: hypothetical protein JWP61_2275 [Friedmanniella sp.]|nr:hypothetical protein [Friedmanniella sp.]
MLMGKLSRVLVTVTLVGLVAGGCTPSAEPTPTPSPTSPSPTESDLERQQRVDYEAAEKAYRTFRAEYRRVQHRGGAGRATEMMLATAGGPYLAEFTRAVQAYAGLENHEEGSEVTVYVKRGGYTPEALTLDVCEDDRSVQVLDKAGHSFGPGEIRQIAIEVRKVGAAWKLWAGKGRKVKSC